MNRFFGFQTTMSASYPTAIAPLNVSSQARCPGPLHIQRTRCSSENFCPFIFVHITGRASCREAIPPQALKKSPVRRCFIAGGDGEWSDATKSIAPLPRAFQRFLLFCKSRMGGAHLYSVRPFGIDPEAKQR